MGLREPNDILIRFSLYQRMYSCTARMNTSMVVDTILAVIFFWKSRNLPPWIVLPALAIIFVIVTVWANDYWWKRVVVFVTPCVFIFAVFVIAFIFVITVGENW